MRRICAPIVLVVTALCTLLPAGLASAAILTVCPKGGCDYSTIQGAIDAASDGDVVLVYEGTYTSNANAVISLSTGSDIHILAVDGPENTIIDGEGQRRGVYVYSQSSGSGPILEGFTITNGHTNYYEGGSGMFIDKWSGSLTVENCIFTNNEASSYASGGGVAVFWTSQDTSFNGCTFMGNQASNRGGGVYVVDSEVHFFECEFSDNHADQRGGGVFINNPGDKWGTSKIATLNQCTINNNTAAYSAGGVQGDGVQFYNCVVSGNKVLWPAWDSGGGIVFGLDSWKCNYDNVISNTFFCLNFPNDIYDEFGCGWSDLGGNTFGSSCACPDGPCTVYVPGDYPTIQAAIDNTGNGDVIEISPGTYYETLDFFGRGALTLRGGVGRGGVVIDAGGVGTAMDMSDEFGSGSGNITVEGITITGGYAEYGGGVYVAYDFAASFEDCTITGNESWNRGGGVYVSASPSFSEILNNASFSNCIISNNMSAQHGGGAYYTRMLNNNGSNENGTPPIFASCIISNNVATGIGGGVYVHSANLFNNNGSITTAFEDCIISQNTANRGGGVGFKSTYGINNNGSNNNGSSNGNGTSVPIILQNCSIVDNTAVHEGGGVWMYVEENDELVAVQLDACQVTGNQADYGGGLRAGVGALLGVNSTTFDQNDSYFGGAMYLSETSDVVVTGSLFLDNEGAYGGGIYNSTGSLDLVDTTFTGNLAYQGGALFEFETISVISGSTFDENTASQDGGAIYNLVSLSEIDTTHFCSNTPDDIYGAWFDEGDVTFEVICGSPAACMGDTNADYIVDVLDLLYVILVWNTDNPLADFNEDGYVDVMDLLMVISNWGICA